MSFAAPPVERVVELGMGGKWSTFCLQFICLMVLIFSSGLLGCYALDAEGIDLLNFRQRVLFDPYNALSSWSSDEQDDKCKWSKVHCVYDRVQMIDLSGLSLRGTLAPVLGNLTDLRALILPRNHFSGSIPRELGSLKRLEVLDLSDNNLSGEIPIEIGLMVSLTSLVLCGNTFEGIIPQKVWDLKLLSEIQFDANLEPENGKEIGCVKRHFDPSSKLSSRLSFGPSHVDQNIQLLYQETLEDKDTFVHRRILLDHHVSANLEALRPKTKPTEVNSLPISISSGSFPALTNSKNATQSPTISPSPPPPSNQPNWSQSTTKIWIYVSIALIAALLISVMIIIFFVCRRRGIKNIRPWKTGLSGQLQKAFVTGVPKLNKAELEVACEDFSNIIESRETSIIYKGTLSSGVEIAVASTTVTSANQWSAEAELAYRKKIEIISRVNHKNFVNLLGYCEENDPFTRMMVYEYAPNGTIYEHLYVKELEHLDWMARMRIMMGVAYCLQHMHGLSPPVVHCYIDSRSVYLTDDYAAKIAERVFSKVPQEKNEMKLEGSSAHRARPESNVYEFGMLLLEMVTGKLPNSEEHGPLLEWAGERLKDKQRMSSLVDPTLKSFKNEELEVICEVMQACVRSDPKLRPTIREVTSRLREVIGISPESAVPRLSPLWWAELEILSMEGT